MAVKFTYFPLWAKGPAIAVALELSGMEWVGEFPEEWPKMKPNTPWRELPVIEVPGVGYIGHEVSILSWIGSKNPKLGGETEKDQIVSSQLMSECEDIYKTLSNRQDTPKARNKVSKEDYAQLWGEPDFSTHNRSFGIVAYLTLLEEFYGKAGVGEGKFTTSGTTVGECKLWNTLHIMKMIKDDVLAKFPGLTAFYERFTAMPEAQSIIKTGGKMPAAFNQYFIPAE
eukprot:CAMPEP_0194764506 /NCGR_PEP_ID=MMETSP0323_2-20130528/23112_1 /TAXON_ID=2866 ORGANISM="Crypthecodinium cohnii, Strain Seligo" /NCGR_SAMPLE_ID=MMETSP0323_2 /ASSEMBLY_ACC=CAM_ASM_000346 /LENGTH=226 /DNA_ID=CAMNT_0039691819 /DNA_START=58 /DNA_END=738 /DNA_ORIENTATION=+